MLDGERCYRAVQSRDTRFDGRFFTGVRSTGIYCRPVCPARTPRRRNVEFFVSAAAAEAAGFRACRRCRPETAPGSAPWRGTQATVTRALELIDAGLCDGASVPALADRLGVGGRHLRRLFVEHVGASPRDVLQTRRAHFARALIESGEMPMTAVAFASGFGSVRRFNTAIRRSFGCTPSQLRRGASAAAGERGAFRVRLAARPPFDGRALLQFLAARAIPGIERVDGDTYTRSLRLEPDVAGILVARVAPTSVSAEITLSRPASLFPVAVAVRRLFDLQADPAAIGEVLGASPRLAAAVRRRPGLRVPGAVCGFETAVRTICGQQVSVAAATTITGRLVTRYGRPLGPLARPGVTHLFPEPDRLARARALPMPGARASAVRALARAVTGGLQLAAHGDVAAARRELAALPGVGPWTVEYLAMRALRDPDAFPSGDLGLRRALASPGAALAPSAAACRRAAESWRPWRAYAAMHLWSEA